MVYLSNYFTIASLEAEMDDHDWDLECEASPQFARASMRMSPEWVQKCKDDLTEELNCGFENEDGSVPEFTWKTEGWKELPADKGRSHQVWDVYMDGELVAKLVIQRAQLDD